MAGDDLAAGRHALTADRPFAGDACFHAQQCAEKAVKAFLAWHDEPFRKTHNLTEMGEQSVRIDPTLAAILETASHITDYAWRFRYPGDYVEPASDEASEALQVASNLLDAVRSRPV